VLTSHVCFTLSSNCFAPTRLPGVVSYRYVRDAYRARPFVNRSALSRLNRSRVDTVEPLRYSETRTTLLTDAFTFRHDATAIRTYNELYAQCCCMNSRTCLLTCAVSTCNCTLRYLVVRAKGTCENRIALTIGKNRHRQDHASLRRRRFVPTSSSTFIITVYIIVTV
jgi:hypothetical protein